MLLSVLWARRLCPSPLPTLGMLSGGWLWGWLGEEIGRRLLPFARWRGWDWG
jgi:hypothetical protein